MWINGFSWSAAINRLCPWCCEDLKRHAWTSWRDGMASETWIFSSTPPPTHQKKTQMFDCFWGMFLLVSNMAVFLKCFQTDLFFFELPLQKTLKFHNWYSTDLSVWPIWKAPQPLPRLELSWAWELTNRPWTFYSVSTFFQKDKQMLPWFESPENIEGRALLNWFIHCAVMAFETF